MPRPTDYLIDGYVCHLTHRCHNRDFHLRYTPYRNAYRKWLREGIRRHKVSVYGYCVTRNHVHVIVHADDHEAVSAMMHLAAGATAKQYNTRRGHLGSVWEHPYQCTLIETGDHLFECLVYVDLNMVRAGVVAHPRQWGWCGYHELVGVRKRYRLLDLDRLVAAIGMGDVTSFRRCYSEVLEEKLAAGRLERQPYWTDSLAVGSEAFVTSAQQHFGRRQTFEVRERDPDTALWTIKEPPSAYNAISPP